MRGLIIASLAAAGLAGVLGHASNGQLRRRKTLGFGPVIPHAVYNTNLVPVADIRTAEDNDPYVVAQRFAETLSRDLSSASSFRIRDDSYTDKATGVTHVYVRQSMYGIEVADGDMNINVKDGAVISYGNSVSMSLEIAHVTRLILVVCLIVVLPRNERGRPLRFGIGARCTRRAR